MEEQLLSIPKAAKILNISRIAMYKKVKKGQIRAIRIGKTYKIDRKCLKGMGNKK